MPFSRCARRGSNAGFSLIELLAVVATAVVLLSILMPLLLRAREGAYRSLCASNLRRLGEAFSLYAGDWEGEWPCPGGLSGNRIYWSQTGPGGLQRYVRQNGLRSVWCCPHLREWRGRYPARSYSMNSYLRTPHDVDYPSCVGIVRGIATGRIPAPRATILLFEGIPLSGTYQDSAYSEDQIYYIYRCANWTWVRGYYSKINHTVRPGDPWHGDRNNYLYADGHVVSRKPCRYSGNMLGSYDEMYEWYVDKEQFRRRFAHLRTSNGKY